MRIFPFNVPNALTFLRILLIPVVAVALLGNLDNGSTIAAIVFALATFTDGLDGYIARARASETTFGKVMDPIADKMLVLAALISLVSLERLDAWIAMVILAREFAVSGLRIVAAERGLVIPASVLGKLKTASQSGAILALIAANDPDAVWVLALVYASVALTAISGLQYFVQARRTLGDPELAAS